MVAPDDFRKAALSMPNAVEGAHRGHPDFRVNGRIFATLGYPDASWGMAKLTPAQQDALVEAAPEIFEPAAGAWGRQGSTLVRLDAAEKTVADAVRMAWETAASR